MLASACTLYELNACTFVKYLVLCFTCPFQIASNRWLGCNVNTDSSMGPGCAWSICSAFATAILHKNDNQLACNRHYWKKKQKQSKKDSQKTKNHVVSNGYQSRDNWWQNEAKVIQNSWSNTPFSHLNHGLHHEFGLWGLVYERRQYYSQKH